MRSFGAIWISIQDLSGSWCVKGTGESTLVGAHRSLLCITNIRRNLEDLENSCQLKANDISTIQGPRGLGGLKKKAWTNFSFGGGEGGHPLEFLFNFSKVTENAFKR